MIEQIAFILGGVAMTFLILAELTYRAESRTEAIIAFEADHPGLGKAIVRVEQVPDVHTVDDLKIDEWPA